MFFSDIAAYIQDSVTKMMTIALLTSNFQVQTLQNITLLKEKKSLSTFKINTILIIITIRHLQQ